MPPLNASLDSLPCLSEASTSTRTTWQIASSCLSTLFICIFTAVHKPTPNKLRSVIDDLTFSAWWVFQILLFPEFALVNAMGKFIIVRSIVADAKADVSGKLANLKRERHLRSQTRQHLAQVCPLTSRIIPF